jgi:DNA-binding transcriptional regulator YdaS (Cro superfamily)
MPKKIIELLEHINSLTTEEQFYFAQKCETSAAHIRNIAHGYSPCSEKLAISLDRESQGKVKCEVVRPDVDWKYLINKGRKKRVKSAKKA